MAATTYTRMLDLLILYREKGLRYEYVRGVHLPIGELPLSAFRSPEIGGDAAHIRMWELRAPEELKKSCKGIPIKKSRRYYPGHDGVQHNIITYTLDIPIDIIDQVLDRDTPRLRRDVLEQLGYKAVDYLDDADGEDKAGQAVRLEKLHHQMSLVA